MTGYRVIHLTGIYYTFYRRKSFFFFFLEYLHNSLRVLSWKGIITKIAASPFVIVLYFNTAFFNPFKTLYENEKKKAKKNLKLTRENASLSIRKMHQYSAIIPSGT
ncbi:hypothetical protein O6U65_1117 [Saccharomyces cerevisiae synthetic construct]|uniref:Putative uncharacterized protein YJL182C n=1 Tax=Saccharomyces cerevisiae (strain ATCC 204508 / S288c) TaxID=559292 RepID=YJS2_YEAST|nr:RecName: Full=Putative uncharacterized protein YJL182C [Saccharomyces cerevisiae S288C]WNV73216.1 hypothetical protein O6U65_1117 [Saccharomyces cerevisiae synthetic construct]CAA89476.1 unnamed protein product [Saccharomyces cerevisiae]